MDAGGGAGEAVGAGEADGASEDVGALFRIAPDEFVAERDARVAAAKERGDKDAATAIGALRRPTRGAWLTNLLVHDRPDEVEGLLGLAGTLASAQRTLDGAALRQVSAQRNKLVGALSRRAAELGRASGHRVDSTLEREVRGILEAALADPDLADRVRTGRLVRAERHAGFGPAPEPGAQPRPSSGAGGETSSGSDGSDGSAADHAGVDGADPTAARRETERRDREIARAESTLEAAEHAAREARAEHGRARDAASEATAQQERIRERLAELVEELDRAREESTTANRAAHTAARTEREAARTARTAETARDRAAAALDELRST